MNDGALWTTIERERRSRPVISLGRVDDVEHVRGQLGQEAFQHGLLLLLGVVHVIAGGAGHGTEQVGDGQGHGVEVVEVTVDADSAAHALHCRLRDEHGGGESSGLGYDSCQDCD